MKKFILFCLLLHFGLQSKVNTRSTPKMRPEWHYINNWDKYNIPQPIHDRDLASILGKIAMFHRFKYCPFADTNECLRQDRLDDVIKKIIQDSVKYSNNFFTEKPKRPCDNDKIQRIARPLRPSFGGKGSLYINKRSRG